MLTSKEIVAVLTGGVAAAGIFIGAISVALAFTNGPDAPTARFVATIALLVGVGASARAVALRRQDDHQGPMTEARRPDTLARLDPRFDPRRWRTEHQVVVAAAIFCGLAFGGLSALKHLAERDDSGQMAECVLSALRDQEKASEADGEKFVRAMRGVPASRVFELMRMMPPPPTVAEAEYARNQQLIRFKELCRLRISAPGQ